MQPSEKKITPVYSSWKTVQNALDSLSKAAVPNVVDRTVFPGLNWAVQSQLLSGLKFLGLLEEGGKPTESLIHLVEDPASRKPQWAAILADKYAELIQLDLSRATMGQLSDALKEHGLTGDTLEKALRFFLSAAEFAELPLSPHLKNKKSSPGLKRSKRQPRAGVTVDESPRGDAKAPNVGTARSIPLRSGGTLTLAATVDLFAMSPEDRQFVFGIIDQIQAYEKQGN